MKELSKEIIEVDNKEYTLFLNRSGIVQWEKITKISQTGKEIQEKVKNVQDSMNNDYVIDENNPFAGQDENNIETSIDKAIDMFSKFYWIALYEHHKMNLTQAKEWFDKAIEEYGFDQLSELARQMIEDINVDKTTKKLKALRPTNK